jgi:hypothetical protein
MYMSIHSNYAVQKAQEYFREKGYKLSPCGMPEGPHIIINGVKYSENEFMEKYRTETQADAFA